MKNRYYGEEVFPEFMSQKEISEYIGYINTVINQRMEGRSVDFSDMVNRLQDEEDFRILRSYFEVFQELACELLNPQQEMLLEFFFDFLFHENGEIRRLAAVNTGFLLSQVISQDKDACSHALRRILFLSGKHSERKRRWIGSALQIIFSVLLREISEEEKKLSLSSYIQYFKSTGWDSITCMNLLQGIMDISWDEWNAVQRSYIFEFIRRFSDRSEREEELAAAGLLVLRNWMRAGWDCPGEVAHYLLGMPLSGPDAYLYLLGEVRGYLGVELVEMDYVTENLYQENLRSDLSWLWKVVNLEILNRTYFNGSKELSSYAAHLLHVLRLNSQPEVFLNAGEDLVKIMPYLKNHQKYQIIQEILKAIELRDDSTNYIPSFLGRTFLYMEGQRGKELLLCFRDLADRKSPDIVKIILETSCVILGNISSFVERYPDRREELNEVSRFFIGILERGLASPQAEISRESFLLAGKYLFEKPALDTGNHLMDLARKILIFLGHAPEDYMDLCNLSPMRRIAEYMSQAENERKPERKKKIAVFSGSFDPFTLAHKELVWEALDMGYRVYINVHDFHNGKCQASLLQRRCMAAMTIADIPDSCLLPATFPVNTENPEDIEKLAEYHPGSEIHIITGHEITRKLKGERIFYRRFPDYYDDLDSSEFGINKEHGKNISGLLDKQVENIIQDWKLYPENSIVILKPGTIGAKDPVPASNLPRPLVLFSDLESVIRSDYLQSSGVRNTIQQSRNRLHAALKGLYPGHGFLTLDRDGLADKVREMILKSGGEGLDGNRNTDLQPSLCVPFGKIMRDMDVADLPVKPLHLEKHYAADLKSFEIRELPGHPELFNQIRILKSFGRPFILVDDIYHKGHRLRKLDAVMKKENLKPDRILVGVLSQKGKELAQEQGISIEAACFVPDMKAWLVESELYPFIGGDGFSDGLLSDPSRSGEDGNPGIPSINTLLPYQMPSFLEDAPSMAVFELSMVCLQNAREIYQALEQEYLERFHHVLTLEQVGKVMAEPRYPAELHPSKTMQKQKVSDILSMEMTRLKRLYYNRLSESCST